MSRIASLLLIIGGVLALVAEAPPVSHRARSWQRVSAGGWQIAGAAGEDPSVTDERERTSDGCPDGMVRIDGAIKQGGLADDVENAQSSACLAWEPNSSPRRCVRFDEARWRTTRRSGMKSILKGGYWGPIRARCRPSTRAHGEDFAFYQIGFRCCA